MSATDQQGGEGNTPPEASSEAARTKERLGPFLCWGVVFADIGTSVYYTPGILFNQPGVGQHAALFVTMTLLVFVLLTFKYAEVTVRYPEGGGVVTVASHALHPIAGLVGGMFILVDYFLTSAISGLSGIIYFSNAAPALVPAVLPITIGALLGLGVINLIGIGASARVNATFAVLAAASQIGVVLAVIVRVGPAQLLADLPRVFNGPHLTPARVLIGYAGAFLAFSGLESISQLSPVMAEPRKRVVRLAMRAVVATMVVTSPLLTLWSTTLLPITKSTDPNQFISLLAGYVVGRPFEIEVAMSAALLLVFASNTALIGSYHVFIALSRWGFLPRLLEQRNRWRNTPHWAILTAVSVPVLVLVASRGSVTVLGDLYAFGLLGAFSLTCLSLDFVRWHELHPTTAGAKKRLEPESTAPPPHRVGKVGFAIGVLTTILVTLAWAINLVAKPLATLFGGGLTLIGLTVALITRRLRQRQGQAPVLPLIHREGHPVVFLRHGRAARPPATVLAVLPDNMAQVGALVHAAREAAAGGPVVFLYRGRADPTIRVPGLFEVVIPYLDDPAAQEVFAQAELIARAEGLAHRYLYIPGTVGPDAVAELWEILQPQETLAVEGQEDVLASLPPLPTQITIEDGVPIRHYILPPDDA
ncbi:MAG: family permease [Chloroflexi bacterium]|nr:family permease [Chloroflexota bacterium]